MRFLILTLIVLTAFSTLFGQKKVDSAAVYRLDLLVDFPCAAGIGLAFGSSRITTNGLKPLANFEVTELLTEVGATGRRTFAERHFSNSARNVSDLMAVGGGLLAGIISLREADSKKARFTNLVMLGEAASLTFFLTESVKNSALQPRPFVYNLEVPFSDKLELDARRSFFSGHTSMAAMSSFFSAKIWCDRHPNSPRKPLVWASAAAFPATVGFLRMLGGKHYFRDVSVGFAVGGLIGWAVPEAHRQIQKRYQKRKAGRIMPFF